MDAFGIGSIGKPGRRATALGSTRRSGDPVRGSADRGRPRRMQWAAAVGLFRVVRGNLGNHDSQRADRFAAKQTAALRLVPFGIALHGGPSVADDLDTQHTFEIVRRQDVSGGLHGASAAWALLAADAASRALVNRRTGGLLLGRLAGIGPAGPTGSAAAASERLHRVVASDDREPLQFSRRIQLLIELDARGNSNRLDDLRRLARYGRGRTLGF